MRLLLALVLFAALPAAAAPWTPTDDAQVLERLRSRPRDPQLDEARRLRAQLSRHPDDLQSALTVARKYIELCRARSDPRYAGRAESALRPWISRPEPPEPVLVLRAVLLQYRHDFAGALDDLGRAVALEPRDAQAWLTLASVQQVRADYAAARHSCFQVLQFAPRLVATTCLAGVASLTGQLASSRALLERTLRFEGADDAGEEAWARTALAEMAVRAGDPAGAEREYRRAIALAPGDPYLLGSYSDFLLQEGRAAEVLPLLRERTAADNLLLRLALAKQAIGSPDAAADVALLRNRFAASRLRGEAVHRREESRFELHALHDPQRALQLAIENWQVQREPADVRVLLEAATAASDARAATPALELLERSHTEDASLAQLLAKVRP